MKRMFRISLRALSPAAGPKQDLGLERLGFKYLPRDPSSFTPTTLESAHGGKFLMLGSCATRNRASIAQFSAQDADAFEEYEAFLGQV